MRRLSKILFCFYFMTGCVTLSPPHKGYALARSALRTAKKFEADKLFPELYLKALSLYKKGELEYKRENYGTAGSYFEESVQVAEKAELKARVKKNDEE